jgi:hypothetical protein
LKKLLARLARQSPSMIVAMLALFVAMGGTAIAASSALITGKQIKNSSITGADVKNKSLTPKDFRGSVRGARGPAGPAGAIGPAGAQGLKGDTGAQGPPGPFAETIPNGKTLRGAYAWGFDATAASRFGADSISFGARMSAPLVAHVIQAGGAAPPECPGVGQAAPGHLCVYEQFADNRTGPFIWNTEAGGSNTSPNGAMVYGYSVGTGRSSSYGSWAATAPATGASAAAASTESASSSTAP